MLIEIEKLKEWYYEERKHLEQLPVFERELNIALADKKKIIADKLNLIDSETLQKIFGDKWQFKFIFEDGINNHRTLILFESLKNTNSQQVRDEYRRAFEIDRSKILPNKDLEVYGEFMFQFIKVEYLEEMLREYKLDPEEIYEKYKNME